MQNHTGKTKTAMLRELESIKDLLVEDDIPILQEVVSQPADLALVKNPLVDASLINVPLVNAPLVNVPFVDISTLPVPVLITAPVLTDPNTITADQDVIQTSETIEIKAVIEPRVEVQENLFEQFEPRPSNGNDNEILQPLMIVEEIATTLDIDALVTTHQSEQQDFFDLTALGELPAPSTDNYTGIKAVPTSSQIKPSSLSDIKPESSHHTQAKATGQNPFLPEHIRARLHGNNPPPAPNNSESTNKIKNNLNRFHSANSPNATSFAKKVVSNQQQIIDELIDYMLPDLKNELRGRLEKLSKKALEDLLTESK